MQTVLPAKLGTYWRSFLTSVSLCAVSHMLHSYLLGVALIIHVASYLPVAGYNFLLSVLFAAAHVSVSLLCVLDACANICQLRSVGILLCSLYSWHRVCNFTYIFMHQFVTSLYFPGIYMWCVINVPVKTAAYDVSFLCTLQGHNVYLGVLWHSVGD